MKTIIVILLSIALCQPLSAQDDDMGAAGKMVRANQAMKERNFTLAAKLYQEVLKEVPEDVSVKQNLANAWIQDKKFKDADSMLNVMIENDSNEAGNYWYKGLCNERQLKDSAAAVNFKQYIQKQSGNATADVKAWLHVGSAYRRMMHEKGLNTAQFDDMVYHYKYYLQVNPYDPFADKLLLFLQQVTPKKPESGELLIWDEKS